MMVDSGYSEAELEPGPPDSVEAVTDPPEKWLLQFTSTEPNSSAGDGRPWGDGTFMAARAYKGEAPWDSGCEVKPIIGGDLTMIAMREALEGAILEAKALEQRGVPPGQRGLVYIADWQLNGLRDLSSENPWGGRPWKAGEEAKVDETALGLIVRLMSAGVAVRILLWMPTTNQWVSMKSLSDEHWSIAAAVQDHNQALEGIWRPQQPIGVVSLDLRTASPVSAALHQKMMVVRVGSLRTAFCGGVDLAFTRRDFGLSFAKAIGGGDWQSGKLIPIASKGWPRPKQQPLGGYPAFPCSENGQFPEDLPANVYGSEYLHWHDHHLQLRGPIVSTLQGQFADRWVIDTGGNVYLFDRKAHTGGENQVQLTSAACIGTTAGEKVVLPLPTPQPEPPAPSGATVQMWRTIPLRAGGKRPPLRRGEFTVMAGIAKAVSQATQLIVICDQYFWSVPLAQLLVSRLSAVPTLRLLIILPPFGATESSSELALRYRALQALWKGLDANGRARIAVFDMWSTAQNRGVYVHAKSQTYDDQLLVAGSANMNRRSFECDAELDCAVLDQVTVMKHLATLYACLTGSQWTDFNPGWLERFWKAFAANKLPTLVKDPFFAENVGEPKTPNGVPMPHSMSFLKPEWLFEPTSIAPPVESSICQFSNHPGEPRIPGRLDEVTYLLERCYEGSNWPWRKPATGPFLAEEGLSPEAVPRLIL
jgi:phosphatidylserine/phosphatidylglycerophosphate/cardiolipin synthase-like enzyme